MKVWRWLAAICLIGCSSMRPEPTPQVAPFALISYSEARFVFPSGSARSYTWDVPRPSAYPGDAEFIWSVTWRPPDEKLGTDPDELSLVTRWRPGGPRTGDLSTAIHNGRLEKGTTCLSCDLASIMRSDAALIATVEHDHVVFTVRGAAAVRRIFPVVPQAVTFIRRIGDFGETLPVPVVRRR